MWRGVSDGEFCGGGGGGVGAGGGGISQFKFKIPDSI